MVGSVNTNGGALVALASLRAIGASKDRTSKQLETGYKVADYSDDAAIFAVAQSVRGLQKMRQAVDSTLARTGMALEVANAGIDGIFKLMGELQAKLAFAGDGSLSDDQLNTINNDYQAYLDQIDLAAKGATIDGVNLIGGEPAGATIGLSPQVSLRAAPATAPAMPAPGVADPMPDNALQAVPASGETIYLGLPIRMGTTPADAMTGTVEWYISIDGAVQTLAPASSFNVTDIAAGTVNYLSPDTATGFAGGPGGVTLPTIPNNASRVEIFANVSVIYPPTMGAPAPGFPTRVDFASYDYSLANAGAGGGSLAAQATPAPGNVQYFPATTVSISGGNILNRAPRGVGGGTEAITTSPLNVSFTPSGAVPSYPASGTEEILFDIRVVNASGSVVAQQTNQTTGAGGTSWTGTLNYEQLSDYQNLDGSANGDSFRVEVFNVRYTERDQPGFPSQSAGPISSTRASFTTSTTVNDVGPTLEASVYEYGENESGKIGVLTRSNLTTSGLGLAGTDLLTEAGRTAAQAALTIANQKIGRFAAYYAAEGRGIDLRRDQIAGLREAATKALGVLIDTDVAETSAVMQSEQVREKLATNALSVANTRPQLILQLFR